MTGSTRARGGNHGLGLAIARCSLEYMGGSVRAADTQKGAEFEITLPQDCRSFAPDEGQKCDTMEHIKEEAE